MNNDQLEFYKKYKKFVYASVAFSTVCLVWNAFIIKWNTQSHHYGFAGIVGATMLVCIYYNIKTLWLIRQIKLWDERKRQYQQDLDETPK